MQVQQFSRHVRNDTLHNSYPRCTPEATAAVTRTSSALLLTLVINTSDTRFAPPRGGRLQKVYEKLFCVTAEDHPRHAALKPVGVFDVDAPPLHPPVRTSSLSLSLSFAALSALTALDSRCHVQRRQGAVMRAHGAH